MKTNEKMVMLPQTDGNRECEALLMEARTMHPYATGLGKSDALDYMPREQGWRQSAEVLWARTNTLLARNKAIFDTTLGEAASALGDLRQREKKLLKGRFMEEAELSSVKTLHPAEDFPAKPKAAAALKLGAWLVIGLCCVIGEIYLMGLSFQAIAQTRDIAFRLALGLSVALAVVFHYTEKAIARMGLQSTRRVVRGAVAALLAAAFYTLAAIRATFLAKVGGNPLDAWLTLSINLVIALALYLVINQGIAPALVQLLSAKKAKPRDTEGELTLIAEETAMWLKIRDGAVTLAHNTERELLRLYVEAFVAYRRSNIDARSGNVPADFINARPTAPETYFQNDSF